MKRVLPFCCVVVLLLSLVACGGGGASKQMRVESNGVNKSKFVDMDTEAEIEYDTLIIFEREMFPWGGGMVDGTAVFIFDDETINDKEATVIGTEDVLDYTLEGKTLTVTEIKSGLPKDWREKGVFLKY